MTQADAINEFIRQLETYTGKKLNYPAKLGELLLLVEQTGSINDFEELIFQAKFLVKSGEMMQRIGPGTEGFERLSTEFQTSVKNSVSRLKLLIEKAPAANTRQHFADLFSAEADGIENFMKLASDLRWIKNWQVDGMPMPYESNEPPSAGSENRGDGRLKSKGEDDAKENPLARIRSGSGLAAALMVLSILIDPPATILGWTLSVVIIALLAYIVLQLHRLR